MEFREGLLTVYRGRQMDSEITDPFYLYCRLSDLCSSSYESKKKIALFYAVDRRLCVFETLLRDRVKGAKELKDSYCIVSDLLSEQMYCKLIECALWVLDPTSQMPQKPAVTPFKAPPKGREPLRAR